MMTAREYKIDKGVDIPARTGSTGRTPKYPWADMGIGDSFFVPGVTPATFGGAVSGTNKRKAPKHFIVRTVDGGIRIWRDK